MEFSAARAARKAGLVLALCCLAGGLAAGQAGASSLLPNGPLVDLPCSNPANHGLAGRVLGAVQVRVGGPLRCFGEAVGHGRNLGPQVMKGPAGYGPAQIQSAYKLGGLSSGGRTVAIVDAYDDPKPSRTWPRSAMPTACRRARPRTAV
jgi:hypothetical protein